MFSFCQVTLWVKCLYGYKALMVCHHPAKFGGHRHCDSGYMFLWAEGKDYTSSHLNLPLLLNFEAHDMKALGMSY